ncbi:hypothetical protein BH23CHL1_BH23CHL1_23650 [soil metagenome]
MSIAISDAIQQARQAIEGGDYRAAIQSCNQLINQFPDYAAAYRVLGEAYLEQGQTADAEQAFAQSLLRDPRQPWAYHGLGLIAEEQNVLDNALAFCQVAWELAPNYAQLRDPVIRIATRRYGADGQAQLTGAALAQIYANTARLQRAAVEYRGALAELPDRIDLKLGLAETLWLLHKEDDAANLCREVLQDTPVAIQALVILADIEGRTGHSSEAADLRARVRAVDPDGAITAIMLSRNAHADSAALLLAADAMPVVNESASAVVAERPHIAPAPDFGYQPSRAEQHPQDIEDLQPISAEEFGSEVAEFETAVDDSAEMTMENLETAELTSPLPIDTVPDDAPSIYRTGIDEAVFGLQPEPDESDSPSADMEPDAADDDFSALNAEFGDIEPMAIEEFGAEQEDIDRLATVENDLLADSGDDLFSDLMSPFPHEGTAADHLSNLTSALEDDVANVLGRAGEQPVDGPQPEAPPADAGSGYTTVLQELGDEGLTPFDPLSRQEMTGQPAHDRDPAAEGGERAPDIDDLARLTEDWDSIDDEIARAVPITTGHTDRLRAADDLGIAPFDFETEDDTSRLPQYRPFGEDDSELVTEADIDAAGEPGVTPEAQPVVETVTLDDEDLLDSLQPFSMEEFDDDEKAEQPFSFASLPWESNPGGSAVPSDEDFEALLSSEDASTVEETPPATQETATTSQSTSPIDWTTAFQDDAPARQEAELAAFNLPPARGQVDDRDGDTSLNATRQIGAEQDAYNEHIAAAETSASDALAARDQEHAAEAHPPTTGLFRNVDPEKLVTDENLFERVRAAKTNLVGQGTISGDRPLVEEELEPVVEQEPQPAGWFDAAPAGEEFVVGTGASRDINTLRASLQAAPNDDELHWWLAEALRERGNIDEAYGEYRWLVRNAPYRADDVIGALNACIEEEQHAEMGHRLLADLYRRRGAVSLASSHAASAMAVRRRLRG